MVDDLIMMKTPGIKEIKQVEMYQKWRPLLPEYAKDITCPKPIDRVIENIRSQKSRKKSIYKKIVRESRKVPMISV